MSFQTCLAFFILLNAKDNLNIHWIEYFRMVLFHSVFFSHLIKLQEWQRYSLEINIWNEMRVNDICDIDKFKKMFKKNLHVGFYFILFFGKKKSVFPKYY